MGRLESATGVPGVYLLSTVSTTRRANCVPYCFTANVAIGSSTGYISSSVARSRYEVSAHCIVGQRHLLSSCDLEVSNVFAVELLSVVCDIAKISFFPNHFVDFSYFRTYSTATNSLLREKK